MSRHIHEIKWFVLVRLHHFFSVISASEIKFLPPMSFILASFHVYKRKASGGRDFTQHQSPSEIQTYMLMRGKLSPSCQATHSPLKNPCAPLFACRNILRPVSACGSWPLRGQQGLTWSFPPHPLCHSQTPTSDPGEHVLWLLPARRKTCKNVMICC